MLKYILAIAVALSATCGQAAGFEKTATKNSITSRLQNDDRRGLATDAFDAMFRFASRHLKETGHQADGDRLLREWTGNYYNVVMGYFDDVGDHAPLSEWVAQWYAVLEADFGVEFMELSHLRDIWVLNYTIGVVFNPKAAEQWCSEQLAKYPQDTCEKEYGRHFIGTKYMDNDPLATAVLHHGFSGIVSYWVTWAACEAATYGTGFFIICGPIAMVVEDGIELIVAPGVSRKIWGMYNPG